MRGYPEYKETGVEWIGKIPSHWEKNKFKFLLREKPKTQNIDLHCGSISFGRVVYKDSEKLTEETKLAYQEVLSGEFLINPLNLNYDLKSLRTALSEIDVIVSSGYIVLQSENIVESNFLKWLLFVFDVRHMKTLGAGIRQTITFKDIGNCSTFIPSWEEQQAIANFLDRETARIDNLIAEKQTFIKLLKEKRQALISHIVTKGLDPTAKMKDSGIEWIGEVPEHWELTPLKYLCKFLGGGTPSKNNLEYWNGSIPWISPKDMKTFWIANSKDKITEDAISNSSTSIVAPGAVLLVVRSGILQRTIPIGINTVPVALNQDMKALLFTSNKLALFFSYWVQGFVHNLLLKWCKQGTTVESIEYEYMSRSIVAVPPEDDLNLILDQLKNELEKLDKITNEINRSIKFLKERRTALISAAVTGKIDVRHYKEGAT